MTGINAQTGKHLDGFDHLLQSVRDILTTPLGSRIMRRDYGADLHKYIDANINSETLAGIYASAAKALRRWEPRLRVTRFRAEVSQAGSLTITVIGYYKHNGQEIVLSGIVLSRG